MNPSSRRASREWLKKAGDRVEVGEPVVELETEKIDLEVSAEKSGVIASIARQEGEDVKIGELLAIVDDNGTAATAPATATPRLRHRRVAMDPEGPPLSNRATPTARRMARDHDVDLGAVQGSGAAGRVTKQDVQKAMTPAPTSDKRRTGTPVVAPQRQAAHRTDKQQDRTDQPVQHRTDKQQDRSGLPLGRTRPHDASAVRRSRAGSSRRSTRRRC